MMKGSKTMPNFPISKLLIPDHETFRVKRQRMVSTFADRSQTGTVYDRFFNKCTSVKAGESRTLAELEGAGLIVRLYFALPIRYRRFLLRDLILRIFFDDDDFPSVEVPLGDFFGLPFGRYTRFSSFFISCTSGGYLCQFPMPFARGARIELVNRSTKTAFMIFCQVNYFELEKLDADCPRFMAGFRRENPTTKGKAYTLVHRKGRGWYVGCSLQAQSLEKFLLGPWREIPFPQGYGLGTLEGWERIFIDGEEEPSFHGTGHEEFFNTGWYFTRKKDPGLFSGNLYRSYLKGRAAAYRQHLIDPIPFSKEIRLEIDHGIDSRIRGDYASCVYWYEQGDRAPLEPLPTGSLHPSCWLGHAAQVVLLPAVIPAALLSAVPGVVRFLRRSNSE